VVAGVSLLTWWKLHERLNRLGVSFTVRRPARSARGWGGRTWTGDMHQPRPTDLKDCSYTVGPS
jgi:hypothetical protein